MTGTLLEFGPPTCMEGSASAVVSGSPAGPLNLESLFQLLKISQSILCGWILSLSPPAPWTLNIEYSCHSYHHAVPHKSTDRAKQKPGGPWQISTSSLLSNKNIPCIWLLNLWNFLLSACIFPCGPRGHQEKLALFLKIIYIWYICIYNMYLIIYVL